jgi:hypothetical protein
MMGFFFLSTLYATHLRRAGRGRTPDLNAGRAVVSAICPRCGLEYFCVVEEEAAPWELAWERWMACAQLVAECPDHAHRFTVKVKR